MALSKKRRVGVVAVNLPGGVLTSFVSQVVPTTVLSAVQDYAAAFAGKRAVSLWVPVRELSNPDFLQQAVSLWVAASEHQFLSCWSSSGAREGGAALGAFGCDCTTSAVEFCGTLRSQRLQRAKL